MAQRSLLAGGLAALLALVLVATPASAAALNGFSRFSVRYPDAGPLDWLTRTPGDCLKVEFGDLQRADHYHWEFGDGTTLDTISSLVDHEYLGEGQYTTLVTAYATTDQGNATQYLLGISTVDGSCSAQAFMLDLLIPLAIAATVFGVLAIAFGRKPYLRYRRLMIAGFIVSMVVLIALLILTHSLGV